MCCTFYIEFPPEPICGRCFPRKGFSHVYPGQKNRCWCLSRQKYCSNVLDHFTKYRGGKKNWSNGVICYLLLEKSPCKVWIRKKLCERSNNISWCFPQMDSIQKEIWDHGGDLRPGTPWWSPTSPSTTPSSRPWLMLILVQAKRNRVVSKHGRLNTYRTDDAEEKHRLCDTISGNKNTLWTFQWQKRPKRFPNIWIDLLELNQWQTSILSLKWF